MRAEAAPEAPATAPSRSAQLLVLSARSAAALERAVLEERRAREARDQAVRAAVKAGVRPSVVAEAAGISPGRVSHLTLAPRA